jgi:hypothetical protein
MSRRKSQLRLVESGPSREVAYTVADMVGRLRRGDVRAAAFVLVMPGGAVATVFCGHRDGHFHSLNSGISLLRQRFDREVE